MFWHLGATLFLFRWIFRDPAVDVRLLVVGAVLPDLVDIPLGLMAGGGAQLWMHTLAAPVVVGSVALIVTRRGGARKPVMTVVVAMLFHLLLDGMWTDKEVFLWPLFGPMTPAGTVWWPRSTLWGDPWVWVRETSGVAYLGWLAAGHGLFRREGLRRFLGDGVLRPSDG